MRYGSEEIQRKKEEDWYQRNYASWAIGNVADFIWQSSTSELAFAAVGGSLQKVGVTAAGSVLPKAAKKILGGLASRAEETVAAVIRSRGGTAANVREAGEWATKSLGDAARKAAAGDPNALKAVKIAKDAKRLGEKY